MARVHAASRPPGATDRSPTRSPPAQQRETEWEGACGTAARSPSLSVRTVRDGVREAEATVGARREVAELAHERPEALERRLQARPREERAVVVELELLLLVAGEREVGV